MSGCRLFGFTNGLFFIVLPFFMLSCEVGFTLISECRAGLVVNTPSVLQCVHRIPFLISRCRVNGEDQPMCPRGCQLEGAGPCQLDQPVWSLPMVNGMELV